MRKIHRAEISPQRRLAEEDLPRKTHHSRKKIFSIILNIFSNRKKCYLIAICKWIYLIHLIEKKSVCLNVSINVFLDKVYERRA